MSSFVSGWRCAACGGKVRRTESNGKPQHFYIYCNYAPCLNSPAQSGGDEISYNYYERGFTPNWIRK